MKRYKKAHRDYLKDNINISLSLRQFIRRISEIQYAILAPTPKVTKIRNTGK
jgi:hypothetical protein